MSPVLFTLFGIGFTLAKALSSAGLLLDMVGVVLLVLNEFAARRHELQALSAVSLFSDTTPFGGEYPFATLERDERRRQREMSYAAGTRIPVVKRMTTRAVVGIEFVGVGFFAQLIGTVLS